MDCFLSVCIDLGIRQICFNGLAIIEKVVLFDVGIGEVLDHNGKVIDLLLYLSDVFSVTLGLDCERSHIGRRQHIL